MNNKIIIRYEPIKSNVELVFEMYLTTAGYGGDSILSAKFKVTYCEIRNENIVEKKTLDDRHPRPPRPGLDLKQLEVTASVWSGHYHYLGVVRTVLFCIAIDVVQQDPVTIPRFIRISFLHQ